MRSLHHVVLVGLLLALLAGCTAGGAQQTNKLYLYTWSDYFDPAVLDSFEQTFGVQVVVDLYSTSEELLAKLRLGNTGYDVVVAADYAVDFAVTEGLLAPLNRANLPNTDHLDPDTLGQHYDPTNRYSLPYFGGVTGIAYNTQFVTEPPTSWAALFEPAQLAPFAGRVSMLDDEREAPGAALKYLGYSLNTTDPNALAEAEALLRAQKPYLAMYNSDDFHRHLAAGTTVLAHAWSGGAATARFGLPDFPGNPDIAFVIPKEGGTRFQDNLAVVAGSPNQAMAELFINYMLEPEVAAQNTDFVLYHSPNLAARELLAPHTQELYASSFGPPSSAILSQMEWIKRGPEMQVFSGLWSRVKGL